MFNTNTMYWGAGLVEGEGYFSLNGPSKCTPMLGIGMTDRDVIERFQLEFAPHNKIYVRYADGCKPFYNLKIVGKRAIGLMFMFFSMLGQRRKERIKEILRAWQEAKPRISRKDVTLV